MMAYRPSTKTSEIIISFFKQAVKTYNSVWNMRERFREIDLSYMRENDLSEEQWRAKQHNNAGDPNKFQNITMPVVLSQVETAVTYQQDVFLTGYPIFGAVASPAHAEAAMQLDTILGEQQVKANWVPELLKAIRNGFKYNLGPVEVSWTKKTSYSLSASPNDDSQKEIIWEGNTIKAIDPYNIFFDTSVAATQLAQQGEFAGYTEVFSRIAFKQFLAELPTRVNVTEALESTCTAYGSGEGTVDYNVPSINPESIYSSSYYGASMGEMDWESWAAISISASGKRQINYRNSYLVSTVYGRILPDDFLMHDVPAKNTPQVWKFIVVNGKIVVYAELLTNVHNLLPIVFCVPNDDGLKYQTKSLAKNIAPIQDITTALSNSMIAARRRAISDRMLYDPLRIAKAQIDSDSPIARIPVRVGAFGTNISEAVYQIPFRDDQSSLAAQDISLFMGIADQISGFNPARKGQFVKGNKTRFEFSETMANAAGRDHTTALIIEGNFFSVIKEILKANILQYQGASSIFNRNTESLVEIDPIVLRQAALEFKLSDGLLPSDKIIDGEALALALQTLASSEQLAQGYNLAPMFSYLMKTRGAKLQPFEKSQQQLAYENAVATWQQTVIAITEQILASQQDMEEAQKLIPPQPLPEQYGYTPGVPTIQTKDDGITVSQRYSNQIKNIQIANSQIKSPNGAATQQ